MFLRELYWWKCHQFGLKKIEIIQNKKVTFGPLDVNGQEVSQESYSATNWNCFMAMKVWFRRWNQKLRAQSQRPQNIITGKKDWAQIKEIRPVPGWISELQRTNDYILSSSLFLNRSLLWLSYACTITVHTRCRGACISNSSPWCTGV